MGNKNSKHFRQPIIYNGKRYDSMTDLCNELKVGKGYLSWYIKNDKPLKGHYLDYAIV
jgi:hypothetical protein